MIAIKQAPSQMWLLLLIQTVRHLETNPVHNAIHFSTTTILLVAALLLILFAKLLLLIICAYLALKVILRGKETAFWILFCKLSTTQMQINININSLLHQIKPRFKHHLHCNLAWILLNQQYLVQLLLPHLLLLLQIHIAQTMRKLAALAVVGDTIWKMASAILSIINVANGLQKDFALNATLDISQSMAFVNY
jgi:hypothetical protein